MRFRTLSILLTAAIAACAGEPIGPADLDPSDMDLFGAKPPTGNGGEAASVSLAFTLRDAAGDAIRSDGLGTYIDGEQDVRAWYFSEPDNDFYGQLHLNTDWETGGIGRTLHFDFSDSGSITGDFATGFQISHAGLDLFNALTVGESIVYPVKFRFEDDALDHTLRVGTACGGLEAVPGPILTLVQEAPRVWTIEHDGNALLCSVTKRGKRTSTALEVSAAFGMTVTEIVN